MGFGADEGDPQFRVLSGIDIELMEHRRQMQGVTGDDVDHRRLEIPHELDLPFAVSGARGNRQRPDLLGAVMEAEASGKQAVSHHVLKNVLLSHPRHVHGAGHDIRPLADVIGRVKDDGRPTRGARRRVHSNQLVPGHCQKPVRPVVPEIVLGGQRHRFDIPNRLHGCGDDATLPKNLFIIQRLACSSNRFSKPFQLQGLQRGPADRFDFLFPIHRSASSIPDGDFFYNSIEIISRQKKMHRSPDGSTLFVAYCGPA